MVKYREILGLHALGSALAILPFSCRCSAAIVRAATDRAKAAALEWPLPEKMGDRAIGEVVFPDNLKQGVVKHAVDEFVINEQCRWVVTSRGTIDHLAWYRRSAKGGTASRLSRYR